MEDRERIAELAKACVCPLNHNPTTPYEKGMVMQYTAFTLMVIEKLGYTCLAEPAEKMVEAVKKILKSHNHSYGLIRSLRGFYSNEANTRIEKLRDETAREILALVAETCELPEGGKE